MDSDIDTVVREALKKARGDWLAIAEESRVSYSWLSKFVNGHINNPGFQTLKKLSECLAERDKRAVARRATDVKAVTHE